MFARTLPTLHLCFAACLVCLVFAAGAGADEFDNVLPQLLDKNILSDKETFVGEVQRVQRQDGAQRIALIDEGQIVAFLSPTARFNLRKHMGDVVGVVSTSVTRSDGRPPLVIVDELKTAAEILAAEGIVASPSQETSSSNQPTKAPAPPPRKFAGSPAASRPVGSGVRQAAAYEPVVRRTDAEIIENSLQGEVVHDSWEVIGDGQTVYDGHPAAHGHDGVVDRVISGQCTSSCVTGTCGRCVRCLPRCFPRCGPRGRLWVRGEYLLWWAAGMDLPSLVTTSDAGTPVADAGVLRPGLNTRVLVGDDDVLNEGQSGFRIRFGSDLGPRGRLRWEGEYLTLGEEAYRFSQRSDGNGSPILARPFFNINPRNQGTGAFDPPPHEDAELVAYPGIVSGLVTVDATTEFQSAGGRLMWQLCCKEGCGRDHCTGCPTRRYSRLDFLAGYRYARLQDGLTISEDLSSLDPNNPARFEITDNFATDNEFHGGEFGFLWQGGAHRLTLEFYSKVALGNVHQVVDIDGQTIISFAGPQNISDGGLLTQASNIGSYERDRFGVMPEFGTTMGWYITPRLQATVGYTFLFLSSVIRPGDQIDLDVNPDQLAPAITPITGPLRPGFAFRETDYWAHGLNVGLDLRW